MQFEKKSILEYIRDDCRILWNKQVLELISKTNNSEGIKIFVPIILYLPNPQNDSNNNNNTKPFSIVNIDSISYIHVSRDTNNPEYIHGIKVSQDRAKSSKKTTTKGQNPQHDIYLNLRYFKFLRIFTGFISVPLKLKAPNNSN